MAVTTSCTSAGRPLRRRSAVVVRVRRLTVVVLAAVAATALQGVAPAGASPVDAAPVAERCEDESHLWVGDVVLDPGARLDTGLAVPAAAAGVGLTVVGVSANGVDSAGRAHPLSVLVGGVRASVGVAVTGGAVDAVHEVGQTGSLRLVGVTVVLSRCTLVSSAAPTSAAPPVGPTAPVVPAPLVSPATPVPAAVPPTSPAGLAPVAPATPAVPVGALLPETGDDPWGRSIVGASIVALGCALVSFGRRRAVPVRAAVPCDQQLTAGGPEPGSPHAAAPHALR